MTQAEKAAKVQRLPRPEHVERLDVPRLLSLLPLRPYLKVADVGSGAGVFTIPLAKTLWDGKVYALDTEQEFLDTLQERVRVARLGNVVPVKMEPGTVPVELGSLDGALLACILVHTEERPGLLQGVAAALRKGGWCAIVDWRASADPSQGPPPRQRVPEDEVLRMLREAELRITSHRDLNDYHYFILALK
ncbi:MAG: class I SAM-dependent methyltransferase [Chloroflexi bacterium]|nr:class I SAM-dependent methyltransferase [Chloroflexota bacterium]